VAGMGANQLLKTPAYHFAAEGLERRHASIS
jgi:hypothetical protein